MTEHDTINLAIEQMEKWKVKARVKITNAASYWGMAYFRRNENGIWIPSVMKISRQLFELNPDTEVMDTILHEIAHFRAGYLNKHNFVWKQQALIVGATPKSCKRGNSKESKYILWCPGCRRTLRKVHRRMKTEKRYCLQCGISSIGTLKLCYNPQFVEQPKKVSFNESLEDLL